MVRHRAFRLFLPAVLVLTLLGSPPAVAGGPITVIGTSADEWNPAGSPDHVAWTAWNGRRNLVFAKPTVGSRFRVSNRTRNATLGAVDGSTLIFQEWADRSDIFLFDLVARTRTAAPAKVNSRAWEYWPGISGDWILFARVLRSAERKVMLYNTSTEELRTLATTPGGRRGLWPGQVNGDYVVWERATWDARGRWTSCEVFIHVISTQTTSRIPNADSRCQYGPGVSADGTVYFGRAGFVCGRNVTLRRYPIGGPAETLVTFARRTDFWSAYASENGDGTTDVFYDPYACGGRGDIVKIVDGEPVPPPDPGVEGEGGESTVSRSERLRDLGASPF